MEVTVLQTRTLYKGFLRLDEATLRYEQFDGTMSNEVTRLNVERGDSVAAVVVDLDRRAILLTNQFRYPAYAKDGGGWILELPAGTIEAGQQPDETMRRELIEELGLSTQTLEHISTFYTTPGGSSERIWLYYVEVRETDRVGPGGGVAAEGENIQACLLNFDEIQQAIDDGRIRDAKSLVGLLWLVTRQDLIR